MPIFEFRCRKCKKSFEVLILRRDEKVKCPYCESEELDRLLSSFGMKGEEKGSSSGKSICASCTATSCSTCR